MPSPGPSTAPFETGSKQRGEVNTAVQYKAGTKSLVHSDLMRQKRSRIGNHWGSEMGRGISGLAVVIVLGVAGCNGAPPQEHKKLPESGSTVVTRAEVQAPLSDADKAIAALNRSGKPAPANAYFLLKDGMTLEEANTALSSEGLELGRDHGIVSISWELTGGGTVEAKFDNDSLVSKSNPGS